MAITKLNYIGTPKGGGAAHLKNAIVYIMNPNKTENDVSFLFRQEKPQRSRHTLSSGISVRNIWEKTMTMCLPSTRIRRICTGTSFLIR